MERSVSLSLSLFLVQYNEIEAIRSCKFEWHQRDGPRNFCAARATRTKCARVSRIPWNRGDFNAMERGLDVDVSPLRVRLQPIYSDRSLEAIQIRYRENAGVINRPPALAASVTCCARLTHLALAFDRPPLIGVRFWFFVYEYRSCVFFVYYSSLFFYPSIMQFVIPSWSINSQIKSDCLFRILTFFTLIFVDTIFLVFLFIKYNFLP